ncbi:MAG: SpoIIE family protein phosphatase, partial [Bacteroidales bacterium]|nr:SpoIIE family protein phosphatase [Bacteroidales bacterium]
ISFSGGFTDHNPPEVDSIIIDFSEIGKGVPFFSFFSSDEFASKEIFSMIEDGYGQILMANRRGIIVYDANSYSFVATPGMPVELAEDPFTKILYVACNNSFGTLNKTDSAYTYFEISKINNNFTGNIDIFFDSNEIFFDYRSFIALMNKRDKSITNIFPPENTSFGGITKINQKNCVLILGKGFFPISQNLTNNKNYAFDGEEIIVSLNNDYFNLFITADNKLYYIENDKIIEKSDTTIEYLNDKIIIGGIIINDYQIALYTLNGGIAFFDVKKEKILTVLNNFTGLPENEVFTMTIDKNGGLWVANNFGLFRYDLTLPILNFGIYPGLEGKILSTQILDTTLYVLTTQGVYHLTKPTSDQEFEDYVKKQQTQVASQKSNYNNTNNNINQNSDNDITEITQIDDQTTPDNSSLDNNQKNNIFKRWSKKIFKKKNNDNNQTDADTNNANNNTQTDTLYVPQDTTNSVQIDTNQTTTVIHKPSNYVRPVIIPKTTKKQFSELYFIFKKVEGIESKCKQAVEYDNKLFVSSNSGLFVISNNNSTNIIENEYITTIQQSTKTENILFVASIYSLYSIDMSENNIKAIKILDLNNIDDYVFSITETDTAIWLGGEGFAYRIGNNSKQAEMFPISPDFLPVVKLLNLNNNLYCYTPQGIFKQNKGIDSITLFQTIKADDAKSVYFIKSQKDIIWFKQSEHWKIQSNTYKIDSSQVNYLNIIQGIIDIKIDNENNLWVVSENNSLYKISKNNTPNTSLSFDIKLKSYMINNVCQNENTEVTLNYADNLIAEFNLMSPFYLQNSQTVYQYAVGNRIDDIKKWSDYTTNNKFEIPLKTGTQYINFRAKNVLNQFSSIKTFKITVKPPFWDTAWFNFLVILTISLIFSLIAILRQKALKNRNIELEKQVKIRTAKIEKQNEELQVQSEEIKRQSNIVKDQRDEIQKTNEYITQSINYARRIQKAILPAGQILLKRFSDYLIISKPRDIVSGDFYWTKEYNNKMYVAVSDCTGHGVPGAFLSMLGTAYLNEITTYKENLTSSLILNSLRQSIIYALQEKEENNVRDGMDISFAIFDFENNTIDFSGAYQSLYLLRKGEIIIYKGDRMPIGYSRKNDIPFNSTKINFKKDDIIYLFTDGYADQFGKKDKSKFMLSNFRKLLKTIGDVPLSIQKELLNEAFLEWKGSSRQIDDITIVAVKI